MGIESFFSSLYWNEYVYKCCPSPFSWIGAFLSEQCYLLLHSSYLFLFCNFENETVKWDPVFTNLTF